MKLSQHKIVMLMGAVTAIVVGILPFFPKVSPQLASAIIGALGTITTLIAKWQDPPSGPTLPTTTALVCLLALCLPACSSFGHFTPEAKSALSVLDRAAQLLCRGAKAEALGMSPEQVAEDVCDVEKDWRPFVADAYLAQRAGAVKAGLAKP